jgi:hypothetical protein
LFIYLFIAIAYFRSLSLGADDFVNRQELDFQDFEQQPMREEDKCPLTILIICAFFLSSSHVGLHALILLPKLCTFRMLIHSWLVMLSHVVLSHRISFFIFMMLSLACVLRVLVFHHRDVR